MAAAGAEAERDYAAEMIAVIDATTPKRGGYTSSGVAEKLIARLDEQDPELLAGWLELNRYTFMTRYISDLVGRRRRVTARTSANESVFAVALGAAEAGDATKLRGWLDAQYVIDEEHTRKRLGELRKDELLFVVDHYDRRIKDNKLEKAFIEALTKRVPIGKTVADVMSEAKLAKLRESIQA